jgi:hypothetical protein
VTDFVKVSVQDGSFQFDSEFIKTNVKRGWSPPCNDIDRLEIRILLGLYLWAFPLKLFIILTSNWLWYNLVLWKWLGQFTLELLYRSLSSLRATLFTRSEEVTVCSQLVAVLANLVNKAFLHLFKIFVRHRLVSLKTRHFWSEPVSKVHELLVSYSSILQTLLNTANFW